MTLVELLRALAVRHIEASIASRAHLRPSRRFVGRKALILAALERGREMHLQELAIASGQGRHPTMRDLRKLIDDGQVRRVGVGFYKIERRP